MSHYTSLESHPPDREKAEESSRKEKMIFGSLINAGLLSIYRLVIQIIIFDLLQYQSRQQWPRQPRPVSLASLADQYLDKVPDLRLHEVLVQF